jgi:hypothetical protein
MVEVDHEVWGTRASLQFSPSTGECRETVEEVMVRFEAAPDMDAPPVVNRDCLLDGAVEKTTPRRWDDGTGSKDRWLWASVNCNTGVGARSRWLLGRIFFWSIKMYGFFYFLISFSGFPMLTSFFSLSF